MDASLQLSMVFVAAGLGTRAAREGEEEGGAAAYFAAGGAEKLTTDGARA